MSLVAPADKNEHQSHGTISGVGPEEHQKQEEHPHHPHPKPDTHHKTDAEKIEHDIHQSLSPQAAGDAIKIVRTRPDLAHYFNNVKKDATSIETALIQGKKAANAAIPDKKDITGVSSGYERLAEGAFEVQAGEAVKEPHPKRETEIAHVDDTESLSPPQTPRHAMREKTYADLPPFPSKNA